MFVLTPQESFWWPVVLETPKDGAYSKEKINLHLKVLSSEQLAEMKDQSMEQFSREVVIGWKDVVTKDGSTVEFNENTFGQLLSRIGVATQIYKQYFKILHGAAEKN